MGYDMVADSMAHAVACKGFLAAHVQLNKPSPEHRGKICAQRFIQSVLLIAEAAAYIGLNYAHAAPVPPQCLAHYAADYVRYLRGTYNVYFARLLIGVAYMVFYVAMLHGGRIVPFVHHYKPGFLYGFFIIAVLV